jgi:hypothetical protein
MLMVVVNGVDGERSRRVMQAQEAVEVHIHRRVQELYVVINKRGGGGGRV